MKAVLYICHGSRLKAAKEEAIQFVTSCMSHIHASVQEVCFLELASPSIEEGIAACIKRGATKIIVIPVFLLAAGHVKKDIPYELQKIKNKYENLEIVYGDAFGVSDSLILAAYKESGLEEYQEEATLLLVARGSSEPEIVENMREIAFLFQQQKNVKTVEVCYLAATEPRFEDKLQEIIERKEKHIVVLPYLLFTGLLMKHIEQEVSKYQNADIHISPYLGKNPTVRNMLIQKTERLLRSDQYVSTYSSN
ncbi:sirohydrochlorin chelatase [Bacillus cytotoxicus]|uniref:Cobalamin (Vitamin B12) biosynthesis CbiX protein n=2 Tax=Bacillus cytotoxicus TaxID=580165 RepID=A0AAX2CEZ9_9BACI|nr:MULTISPECIES: sirohydrochlorin chelatase [Bacillus cereus group]ABS21474.1 cobalamin (vitamin B12) biosynthesis CbiX protein [Bacillus cytotoxicus NVH 391-98]AWC28115.1 sirohydrochlorin chelatase [Bacillus cytotoxicus]AWC32148.1 sirohydrochlorin chelatase [Bacillus cytotoxicus]AWC36175.1 sirohydrochlorin chelatase [Bacillus cytotoxicus]AWC40502.1 sirohydrochlorin chelatase [Bacillus cytotoxicus]